MSYRLLAGVALLAAAQATVPSTVVLYQHPAIRYAETPTTDRVAKWNRMAAATGQTLTRDARTGYLKPLLDALGVPADSQLLVFSKTGVQSALTGPHTPRALYFDESVVVGYIPGAPAIEIAAHDPQQGVNFYTIDQNAAVPAATRRTACLSCHVSHSTLEVPGLIARSNFVDDDGKVLPQLGSQDVDHRTSHPDRWGGWFVTFEDGPPPYSQRAHQGNITFTLRGNTSNEVFGEWMASAPEEHGYLRPSSDIVALLAFDHQARAINLLTRLNWEWRAAAAEGGASVESAPIRPLVDELADYLLFTGEAAMPVALKAPPALARNLEAHVPRDRQGRSLAQLDLVDRLSRYACSYMIYSEAFDGLADPVKQAVYQRIVRTLSASPTTARRQATLDILRETKAGFPGAR